MTGHPHATIPPMSFGWHVVFEFQPTHRSYTRTAVGPLVVQDRNVPCDRVVQVLFNYSTRLRIPRAYIDEHIKTPLDIMESNIDFVFSATDSPTSMLDPTGKETSIPSG